MRPSGGGGGGLRWRDGDTMTTIKKIHYLIFVSRYIIKPKPGATNVRTEMSSVVVGSQNSGASLAQRPHAEDETTPSSRWKTDE